MTIRYLLEKEFIQIMRNTFIPKMIFMFPIIIMCVTPWVTSFEVKNIKVSVVDNDHTTLSSRLIHRIEASDYFVSQERREATRRRCRQWTDAGRT